MSLNVDALATKGDPLRAGRWLSACLQTDLLAENQLLVNHEDLFIDRDYGHAALLAKRLYGLDLPADWHAFHLDGFAPAAGIDVLVTDLCSDMSDHTPCVVDLPPNLDALFDLRENVSLAGIELTERHGYAIRAIGLVISECGREIEFGPTGELNLDPVLCDRHNGPRNPVFVEDDWSGTHADRCAWV